MSSDRNRARLAVAARWLKGVAALWIVGCASGPLAATPVEAQTARRLQVQSASFSDGSSIPKHFTCDGANVSPDVRWSQGPAGTRSFALIVDDPDATTLFTHWMVYNLSAGIRRLPEGASGGRGMPAGAAEGVNSFGRSGYGGPCPPQGRPHHYIFHVYALDIFPNLPPGAGRGQLDAVIQRHAIGAGQLIGSYQR